MSDLNGYSASSGYPVFSEKSGDSDERKIVRTLTFGVIERLHLNCQLEQVDLAYAKSRGEQCLPDVCRKMNRIKSAGFAERVGLEVPGFRGNAPTLATLNFRSHETRAVWALYSVAHIASVEHFLRHRVTL